MTVLSELTSRSALIAMFFDVASGFPQDSSGNAYHCYFTGDAPTYSIAPVIPSEPTKNSIRYDGVNDYHKIQDAAALRIGNTGTIIWFGIQNTRTGVRTLVDKGNATIQLGFDGTAKRYHMNVNGVGGDAAYASVTSDDANPHMAAIGKNGSTRKVWIDGVDRTTLGTDRTATTASTTDINLSREGTTFGEYANATWGFFAYFATLLSDADIAAIWAAVIQQNLLNVGAIATAEALGTPVIAQTGSQALSAVGAIASAAAAGTPVLGSGVVGLTSVGAIASGEAAGTPTIGAPAGLTSVGGIASAEALGVPTTAQPVTRIRRPARKFKYPTDTIDKVNAVFVQGAPGITAWRYTGGIAPPAGTRRATAIRDDSLETLAQAQAAGDALLATQGTKTDGSYTTWFPGLIAGQVQHIKNSLYTGIDNDFPLLEVTMRPIGPSQAMWDVRFGAQPLRLTDLFASHGQAIASAAWVAEGAAAAEPDTIAPAAPGGFSLLTATRLAPDGTQRPYIQALWAANVELDLDAYEVQLDDAIEGLVSFTSSASGSGGTLGAGDYAVVVTGVGAVQGETMRGAPQLVTITAGQRLFVNITAKPGIATYKVYASRLGVGETVPKFWNSTATTGSNVEVTAEGAGAYPPATSTAVDFTTPKVARVGPVAAPKVSIDDVVGGVYYAGRVRAVDKSGNYSGWSGIYGIAAAADGVAPDIPVGLVAIAGNVDQVGLMWSPVSASDLAYYEVSYAPTSTLIFGTPFQSLLSFLLVSNLDTDISYTFRVRAVDRSGNVRTSVGDPTPVLAADNPDAGWSTTAAATPGQINGNDIALGTIISGHISAIGLDAGIVKTGTLSVGGTPNTPDFMLVYNSAGQEIGRWDANGLLIKDPTNTARQVRFLNGIVQFSKNNGVNWTTAISADGIIADSVVLGSAVGGHNLIPNSGFELSAFQTTFAKLWTSATDWGSSIAASDVNVDKSTTELRMTTFTY